MENIFTRRSVRKYDLSKKVSKEDIDTIIKAGFAAPSAKRQEPASFIVIDDSDLIERLSHVSSGSMLLTNCNLVICVLGANPETLAKPTMVAQDLGATMENMMICARALGLGTCWIGVYPEIERMGKTREILSIPDSHFPFSLMALGYPESNDVFKDLKRYYPEKIHHNGF